MPKLNFSKRDFLMPATLIIFFLIFYFIYEDIKDRTIEEYNSEQVMLAKTASQGMTSFFDERISNLTFLSGLDEIIDFRKEGEKILANFYNTHKHVIEAVTRVDTAGIIIHTYPYNQSVIGNDISYQNHVKQMIRDHKPVISDVFLAAQGYLAIAITVPVYKKEEFAGSLTILIPIDKLGKLYLGSIKIRETGNVWLLSENGVEIYCPYTEHIGKSMFENMQNSASSRELKEKIKTHNSGTILGYHSEKYDINEKKRNDQYISFFRTPLGNTYWTILISYQEKDIYEAIAILRNRLILVFSLLFITISYFFYSLARVRNVLKAETKRKKAEKTLLKSEEKFRRLFEDHKAIKLLIDPNNGKIIDANKSASDFYGWSCEELKKKNISELNILPMNEVRMNIEKVKSMKEMQFEFKHRLKNGSVRDVEVFSSLIETDEKDMLHSIIYDITYRKQVEEALIKSKEKAEESDRLKTAFLQNMSHEIRTPMNAIMGFSSLLTECYNDKPLLEEYSEIISERSKDLLEIIDDILNISRIESGQLMVDKEEFNLHSFFNELNSIFYGYQKRIGKQQIAFNFNLPDDLALKAINTDKGKLRQIFANLLSNAFKNTFTGKIEGGCKLDENQNLIFYVSDTGIGIPLDKQEIIFERFAQLKPSKITVIAGTGLGLSIAKGLVELMGGKIWLDSKVGVGTSFYFTFPIIIAETTLPENEARTRYPYYQFNGETVLLVEDDLDNYIYIKALLTNSGLKIIHAESGKEAVQLALTQSFNLILLDIRLPDINGYEAMKLIKQKKPDIKIIAQTAFAAQDDKKKALDAGCVDYISKPIDRLLLLDMLKKHIPE